MDQSELKPGDSFSVSTVQNSTDAELYLMGKATEYQFEITSAPPTPNNIGMGEGWRTTFMLAPNLVTIRVMTDDTGNPPRVMVAGFHGYRILKSGEININSAMKVYCGADRSTWPAWLQSAVEKFETRELV